MNVSLVVRAVIVSVVLTFLCGVVYGNPTGVDKKKLTTLALTAAVLFGAEVFFPVPCNCPQKSTSESFAGGMCTSCGV